MMVSSCEVCREQAHKYKCPKCFMKYCSLPCFKKHKESQCVKTEQEDPDKRRALTCNKITDTYIGPDEDSEDRVSPEDLEKLGQSDELLVLLKNPHLQQMIKSIDSSTDIAKAMDTAMREPIFTEFADQCLKIADHSKEEAVSNMLDS